MFLSPPLQISLHGLIFFNFIAIVHLHSLPLCLHVSFTHIIVLFYIRLFVYHIDLFPISAVSLIYSIHARFTISSYTIKLWKYIPYPIEDLIPWSSLPSQGSRMLFCLLLPAAAVPFDCQFYSTTYAIMHTPAYSMSTTKLNFYGKIFFLVS